MTDTTPTPPDDEPVFIPQAPPDGRQQGLDRLREPFPPNQVGLLPKPIKKDQPERYPCRPGTPASADGKFCGGFHVRSVHLDYVGHAALTDRLLDADPAWTWEPVAFGADGLPVLDRQGGLWIRLTVQGVTRLGYGDAQGKTGPNAIKEAIGDALRNAGMRFGAALDLWHKGDLHDTEEAQGRLDERAAQPDLPAPAGPLPAAEAPSVGRPSAGPNQQRRIDQPAQPGQGDEWVARGMGVQTAEQVLEVYQAARKAGALGAAVTVNGRSITVRDYLRERGAGLKQHEERQRGSTEQPLRADVLDPAPWDVEGAA